MLQNPFVRVILGILGALAGAGLAWTLTWVWYTSLHPRGIGWHGPPTVSWEHQLLIAFCIMSGAVVGLALTQMRYLPADDETGKE